VHRKNLLLHILLQDPAARDCAWKCLHIELDWQVSCIGKHMLQVEKRQANSGQ
jgi:hypothetical protein